MVANDCEREICYGVLCGLSLLLVLALSWPCSEGHSGSPPPPLQKANIYIFGFFAICYSFLTIFAPLV